MDRDLEAPCITCTGYSNYVKGDLYMSTQAAFKPITEAIDDWFAKGANGVTQEDFWTQYDTVNKPKHYMLFEQQGIEVRDVIEQLLGKLTKNSKGFTFSHQCASDYVQMMQYLMRFMDKNGVEDLKKARWYLDKLIDSYESDV
jgi:hypothetical protein